MKITKKLNLVVICLLVVLQVNANSFGNTFWRINSQEYLTFTKNANGYYLEYVDGSYKKIASSKIKIKEGKKIKLLCFLTEEFASKPIFNAKLVEITWDQELLIIESNQTADPVVLLPCYKIEDSFFDRFLIDDNISQKYASTLIEKKINPFSVCKDLNCLRKNPLGVEYLAITDWTYNGRFNFLMRKEDLKVIQSATNLKKLLIFGMKAEEVPKAWSSLSSLEEIHLINCGLEKFNLDLNKFPKLKVVNLSNNQLSSFELGGSIQYFNIKNNVLSELKFQPNLTSITEINISNNKVINLPLYGQNLQSLKFLDLRNNKFNHLIINQLTGLEHILFNGNGASNVISSDLSNIKSLGVSNFIDDYFINYHKKQFTNLEQLFVTNYTEGLEHLEFPNLIHFAFVENKSNKPLELNPANSARMQTLSLPPKEIQVLDQLPDENSLHTITILEFDFEVIENVRFENPTLTVNYFDYDNNLNISQPMSEKEILNIQLLEEKEEPHLARFLFLTERKEDLMGYQFYKFHPFLKGSAKSKIFIKASVAEILSKNSSDKLENLSYEEVFFNDELKIHEEIVQFSKLLPSADREEMAPILNRSKSIGLKTYGTIYNRLLAENKSILGAAKTLNLKSINVAKSSDKTKVAAKHLLIESQYYSEMSKANNYGKSGDEYSTVDGEIALATAGASIVAVGVAGVQKLVSNRKNKKVQMKIMEAEEIKEMIKKLSRKIEIFKG